MKIINREMGGGKTHALVELMLEPGNEDVIFVAPTYSQAQEIGYRTALSQGYNGKRDRFVAVGAILGKPNDFRGKRFVIDEGAGVIGALIGGKVLAIAGTDEDLEAGQRQRIRENRERRKIDYAA